MPAAENTIWGQIENDVEIDVTDVPNLFAQKPAAAAATKEVSKDHHLADLGKALIQNIGLFDSKARQAVEIAMKKFPSPEEIVRCLNDYDKETLKIETIEVLLRIWPAPEMIEELLQFDPTVNLMREEAFFYKMLKSCKTSRDRLIMWDFRDKWSSDFDRVLDILSTQLNLYKAILGSPEVHKVFKAILQIGNVLNDGTAKGGAEGFDIDVIKLAKPSAIKDASGKSLLQFACKKLSEKDKTIKPNLSKLKLLVLINIKKTELNQPYSSIKTLYDDAETAYKRAFEEVCLTKGPENVDTFTKEVGKYITGMAATQMDIIENTKASILMKHIECCDFYCFAKNDELRQKPTEFFEMWISFLQRVEAAF